MQPDERQGPQGYSRFFRWVDKKCEPITDSLEVLSHQRIDDPQTPMIERVSMAWAAPVDRLSCEQVRLLTSQKMGLEWLAVPITIFVRLYPAAFVTFYPGDLSFAALRAFPDLLAIAPEDARAMIDMDFNWLANDMREVDPRTAVEIEEAISNARILARGHS
jgi:hypothetical protein